MNEMLALLPMKGHSERVPGKNVKALNGLPLFFYVADTLRMSKLFVMLAIDTDSPEIAEMATRRYGGWAHIIERPAALRGDCVPMNSIIAHDIAVLGANNDYFQTHSTNPLMRAETIAAAVEMYRAGKHSGTLDSVFSVNALHTRLYDRNLRPMNHDPSILLRTQDLDVIYEENSNFYIFSGRSFEGTSHRIGCKPAAFVMKRNSPEVLDIDELSDWDLAEIIIKSGFAHE